MVFQHIRKAFINERSVTNLSFITASGGKLVDTSGTTYVPHSINWYGFEQELVPQGLENRPYKTITVNGTTTEGIMDQIKRLGFNSIRLLFCQDITWNANGPPTVDSPWTPQTGKRPSSGAGAWNDVYINPDLNPDFFTDLSVPQYIPPQALKTSLEMLDLIVEYAGVLGLRIIADMHCLAPNDSDIFGDSIGGDATTKLWYTTTNPGDAGATAGIKNEPRSEAQAIAAHVALALRYNDNPVWLGQDLINEPAGGTWDRNTKTGLVGYYERCGNAIQAINPHILVVCEGSAGNVDYGLTAANEAQTYGVVWSGNLSQVIDTPVTLNIPNKVVYSPHEYGSYGSDAWGFCPASFKAANPTPLGYAHQWFYDPLYPANMSNIWSKSWGYLAEQDIAPVWIGECGAEMLVPPTGGSPNYNANNLAADEIWLTNLSTYIHTNNIGIAIWALNPGGTPRGYLSKNVAGLWSTDPNPEQEPYYSALVAP